MNVSSKSKKVKFDDKLKLDKLRFTSPVTSDAKTLEQLSKQLESKLATSIADFLMKEYFNVVNNAITHVTMPMFKWIHSMFIIIIIIIELINLNKKTFHVTLTVT